MTPVHKPRLQPSRAGNGHVTCHEQHRRPGVKSSLMLECTRADNGIKTKRRLKQDRLLRQAPVRSPGASGHVRVRTLHNARCAVAGVDFDQNTARSLEPRPRRCLQTLGRGESGGACGRANAAEKWMGWNRVPRCLFGGLSVTRIPALLLCCAAAVPLTSIKIR